MGDLLINKAQLLLEMSLESNGREKENSVWQIGPWREWGGTVEYGLL